LFVVGWDEGRVDDALTLVPAARAAMGRAGVDLDSQADGFVHLAMVYMQAGKIAESRDAATHAVALYERACAPDGARLSRARNLLGVVLRRAGRNEEALAELAHARAILVRTLGAGHVDVAGADLNICASFFELGRYEEARAACERSMPVMER